MVNISWGNLLQIVYSIISYMKCDKKKVEQRMGRHSMSLDTCVRIEFIRYCFILFFSIMTNRFMLSYCSLFLHFQFVVSRCFFRGFDVCLSFVGLIMYILLHSSYNSRIKKKN